MSSKSVARTDVKIQTFVFFDLETNGLIQRSKMPKITEMSLVATSRDSLFVKKEGLPRVMHKLTILLQPMEFIPLEVSEITGLYNDLLELEKPFDQQAYELLNSFLGRLCFPICFVAHNGIRFDYPVLLSSLNSIGKDLSETILCIDTIPIFKAFFCHNENKVPCVNASALRSTNKYAEYFNDGWDEAISIALDNSSNVSPNSTENDCFDETKTNQGMTRQQLNETTPTHKTNVNPPRVSKKPFGRDAKKRLPFTEGGPRNFKLETIYEHLVGKMPINSHTAEADCLALLTCAMKISDFFVEWVDNNASPLVQYTKNN